MEVENIDQALEIAYKQAYEKSISLGNDMEEAKRAGSIAQTKLFKQYQEELQASKQKHKDTLFVSRKEGDYFPLAWMTKNTKINKVFERCPKLIAFLNWVDSYALNPNLKGDQKKVRELFKLYKYEHKIKEGRNKRQKENLYYSYFVVDAKFYRLAIKNVDLSLYTLRLYLNKMVEIRGYKLLGRAPKKGEIWVYADGYYQARDGRRPRKIRFISEKIKAGLRKFRVRP